MTGAVLDELNERVISNLPTWSAVVVVEAFDDCLVVLDPLGDAAFARFSDQTKLVRHVLVFV